MLAYDVFGEGPRPLVILHGFLGAGRNLFGLARRISAADDLVRAVLPDHLGHGRSPPLPDGADLFTLARAVLDLTAALAKEEAVPIVGHSLGGRVALAAKKIAPEKVDRIVLLDIAPGPTAHLPATHIASRLLDLPDEAARREDVAEPLLAAGFARPLVDWLLMNLELRDGRFTWRIDRRALLDFHERSGVIDLWDVVESGADVAAVRGERSPYVTRDDVSRFEACGVRVATIEGAGHFLHAERTDATFERIQEALAR